MTAAPAGFRLWLAGLRIITGDNALRLVLRGDYAPFLEVRAQQVLQGWPLLAHGAFWHLRRRAGERIAARWHLVVGRVLNRVATDQMRHAAFLLGWAMAFGYASHGDGLLGHLHEHGIGNELGLGLRCADDDGVLAVGEQYRLEHSRWATAGPRNIPARSS